MLVKNNLLLIWPYQKTKTHYALTRLVNAKSDVDKKMSNIISLSKKWIKENQKYWWRFVVFLHEVAHSLVSKLRPKVEVNYENVNYEDVNYERAKKDKLERDLKAWKKLGTYNK